MFSSKDYKPEVDKATVDKLTEFANSLDDVQRECLLTLVTQRDDLLKMEEEVPVTDAEIDALIKELG